MTSAFRTFTPVVVAVALVVAVLLPTNPLADPGHRVGASLLDLPPPLATGWLLLAAGGLLGATWALRTRAHRAMVAVVVAAVVVALLLLDQSLLAILGYVPFAIGMLAQGRIGELGVLLSPALLLQALVAAGCAALLLELRARADGSAAVPDPDALALATHRTRRWTLVAIEAPLVYALSRVLMFFQVPGFSSPEFDADIRWAGLGLAGAACVGALLTWGLVADWGSRFPRWVPGLGGRPVPVGLALVPALAVAVLILAAFRGIVVGLVTAPSSAVAAVIELPLVALPQLLWPLWSVALALAAVHYSRRRMLTHQTPVRTVHEV